MKTLCGTPAPIWKCLGSSWLYFWSWFPTEHCLGSSRNGSSTWGDGLVVSVTCIQDVDGVQGFQLWPGPTLAVHLRGVDQWTEDLPLPLSIKGMNKNLKTAIQPVTSKALGIAESSSSDCSSSLRFPVLCQAIVPLTMHLHGSLPLCRIHFLPYVPLGIPPCS